MNEPPKSFWRKSWPTPPWIRIWLILLALTLVVITCLIAFRSFGFPDWPTVVIVPLFSLVAATLLLVLWFSVRWFGLLCWHHWQRAVFLLASVATAMALFYAEEDWRGWHAWARLQRQAEAKGVHFDFASAVPPPVPADQNFALTPLVASSYAEMIDPTGHEIRPHRTNVVNRLLVHYWLVDDSTYPSQWNQWLIGNRTDLAAWQLYYRTLATRTNLIHFATSAQSPAADVLQVLSRFDSDIEELRQDSQLPYSRFPLEYDKENPWAILLPHLAALKCADQLLSLRAIAELQTGRNDLALADVKLQLRLTESVRTEPFLVSHLVRLAMVQLTLQIVWEGLADHRWSETQLAELETELGRLDFLADYQTSMRADRVYMASEIAFLRRHPEQYLNMDGDGGLAGSLRITPESDRIMALLSTVHLVPSGWYYQNQTRYVRDIERFYWPAADVQARQFLPGLIRQGDAWVTNQFNHLSPYNILECLFYQWPIAFDAGVKFAHGQASVDLARVAIGLERFRLAQGKYPDSLAVLAPQYLNPVPHDVIGGQPLHYRLTDDGQFVLYSIGWNERDDGGVVAITSGKTPGQDLTQGDWVWRYPPK